MNHRAFLLVLLTTPFGGCGGGAPPDAGVGGDDLAQPGSGTAGGDLARPDPALIAPARPLSPPSSALVGARPLLRWELPPGTDGAAVELCADRDCARPIASLEAGGESARPESDLPRGPVFWRLRGRAGSVKGTVPSPTWHFTVGAATTVSGGVPPATRDFNGDGYADLAIGRFQPAMPQGPPEIYVYFGGPNGPAATPDVTLSRPADEPPWQGLTGFYPAASGDWNGDGYTDLAVNAPYANGREGVLHIYYGSAKGIGPTPDATLSCPPNPDGCLPVFRAPAPAGDVNGDGFDDLLAGPALYLGGRTGLPSLPDRILTSGDDDAQLTAQLTALGAGYFFMHASGAGVGDVNGDGFADIVLATPLVGTGNVPAGAAYFYLGGPAGPALAPTATIHDPFGANETWFGTGLGAGDANGDGFADVVIMSLGPSAPGPQHHAGRAFLYLGGKSGLGNDPAVIIDGPDGANQSFDEVVSVGDVDQDGHDDFIFSEGNGPGIYLFLGNPDGLPTMPSVDLSAPPFDPDSWAAHFVAPAGDVNGDGWPDVVTSNPEMLSNTGEVWLFSGSARGLAPKPEAAISSPPGVGAFGDIY